MALATDQVQLIRSSGSLLMGPGTPYTVLPEWDPWSRTNRSPQRQDRPYSHGSMSGSQWVNEAVVLIPISVYRDGASRTAWTVAQQALSAAFTAVGSSGEVCELRFEWAGTEYVMFGTPDQVRVDGKYTIVGKSVDQCAFTADDPRIYSAELVSVSTGLPVQQGGLTFPATFPFTIDGTLISGRLSLTNSGTAPSGLVARIDGPVVDPILLIRRPDGVVQSIAFTLTLLTGQYLQIDTTTHLALLNGLPQSNQRGRASWTVDAYPLQPGVTEFRFMSSAFNDAALVTVEYRSSWW